MLELPPTPVTALTLIVLECTEFVEPYIPEDQERDEATGQPKKKARLDDSTNGGSPASQHAVISTPVSAPVPFTHSNGTAIPGSDAQDPNRRQGPIYPNVLERPSVNDSVRAHPYMPRPPATYAPPPRPFVNAYSPSPWSPIGSVSNKPSTPTLSQGLKPHPYTPTAHTFPHSPNSQPNGSAPTLPTAPSPLIARAPPATGSVPTSGRPELPDFSSRPVSTHEVQLAMQASLERQQEEEKEKRLQNEEKERKWEEMRAKAASIVETVRKEGINGGSM
jgi:hypothetical protein